MKWLESLTYLDADGAVHEPGYDLFPLALLLPIFGATGFCVTIFRAFKRWAMLQRSRKP